MAKQLVNVGTSVNKGDGDPLRTAFQKINDNFNELYASTSLDLRFVSLCFRIRAASLKASRSPIRALRDLWAS